MIKPVKFASAIVFALSALLFVSCKEETAKDTAVNPADETLIAGNLTLQVDNAVQPIVEDVLAIFRSVYPNANITQVNRNEADILQALLNDSARVAVLSRELTTDEEAHFTKLKISPRTVPFAKDALALVASKEVTDTLINLEDIYKVMRGEEAKGIKQLVVDNSRSGSVRYLQEMANSTNIKPKNLYSLKNTTEVLTFVKNNPGSIGVVGVNWLLQPPVGTEQAVKEVRVLAVSKGVKGNTAADYYKPSQSNLSQGNYPLARTLYIINYQGKKALGMGLSTYLTSPEGQRIILKSGLLPLDIPPREIQIINE